MVLSFGEVLMDCLPDKNVIGGAPFNVVTHLKRMGEESGMISKIGKDELGEEILSFLKTEKIDEYVQVDDVLKTGYVSVKLNNGQPTYTIHRGCGWEFIDYKAGLPSPKYLVFGSLALHFPHNKSSFIKYKEQFKDAICICDINLRAPFYDNETIDFCFSNTDILKINDEELIHVEKENNVKDGIQFLKEKYKINKVILTKGEHGAELFWEGKHYVSAAGKVTEMKDTVGAGDSFTSMFIFGLLNNVNAKENLKRASDFSALICEQNGAIPSDKSIYQKFKV